MKPMKSYDVRTIKTATGDEPDNKIQVIHSVCSSEKSEDETDQSKKIENETNSQLKNTEESNDQEKNEKLIENSKENSTEKGDSKVDEKAVDEKAVDEKAADEKTVDGKANTADNGNDGNQKVVENEKTDVLDGKTSCENTEKANGIETNGETNVDNSNTNGSDAKLNKDDVSTEEKLNDETDKALCKKNEDKSTMEVDEAKDVEDKLADERPSKKAKLSKASKATEV